MDEWTDNGTEIPMGRLTDVCEEGRMYRQMDGQADVEMDGCVCVLTYLQEVGISTSIHKNNVLQLIRIF